METPNNAQILDKGSKDPDVIFPKNVNTNILGFSIDKSEYNVNFHGKLSTSHSGGISFTTIIIMIIILLAFFATVYLYLKFGRKQKIALPVVREPKVRTTRHESSQTPLHTIQIE